MKTIKRNKKGQFVKRFGAFNFNWKGGRIRSSSGYILLRRPNHPYARNGYVFEHRLIMEKKLGRYLIENEVIHHMNHVRDDNREENLMLLTRREHGLIKKTPEHLKNISEASKKAWREGRKPIFQGRHHSEETKRKMSNNQKGSKNSHWKHGKFALQKPYKYEN